MKGRTVFSHTDVPAKSLFIENRIKKIKFLMELWKHVNIYNDIQWLMRN